MLTMPTTSKSQSASLRALFECQDPKTDLTLERAALALKLWEWSERDLETGCWVWQRARAGKKLVSGGGQYPALRVNGSQTRGHRLSYMVFRGDIPPKLQVMHTCHNSLCVNPRHLEPGTNAENAYEKALAGRAPARLTVIEVGAIRGRCAAGELQRVVAEDFGIAQADVSNIVNRKYWRYV